MNVDWFKPHKLTESKVGAIYLTVMNFIMPDSKESIYYWCHLSLDLMNPKETSILSFSP